MNPDVLILLSSPFVGGVFALAWVHLLGTFAAESGWRELAKAYPRRMEMCEAPRRWLPICLRGVSYPSALIRFGRDWIELRLHFPFSFFHPPIQLPRRAAKLEPIENGSALRSYSALVELDDGEPVCLRVGERFRHALDASESRPQGALSA